LNVVVGIPNKRTFPKELNLPENFIEYGIEVYGKRLKIRSPVDYEKYCKMSVEEKWKYIKEDKNKIVGGPSEEYRNKIETKYRPILQKNIESKIPALMQTGFLARYTDAVKNYAELRLIIYSHADDCENIDYQQLSRLLLPSYLVLYGGLYIVLIDIFLSLIMADDFKFEIINKKGEITLMPNVISFDQFEKQPDSQKLKFLIRKGFTEITDAADTDLRNFAAHPKVSFGLNGSITCFDGGKKSIFSFDELEDKIDVLLTFCGTFNDIFSSIIMDWVLQAFEKIMPGERKQLRSQGIDMDFLKMIYQGK